jgi:hypothetical protein
MPSPASEIWGFTVVAFITIDGFMLEHFAN